MVSGILAYKRLKNLMIYRIKNMNSTIRAVRQHFLYNPNSLINNSAICTLKLNLTSNRSKRSGFSIGGLRVSASLDP
jgi:hypothetical protein